MAKNSAEETVVKTPGGTWHRDRFGMWHYDNTGCHDVEGAARVAVKSRPKSTGAWFWFNNIPVPVDLNDTPEQLYERWRTWRSLIEASNGNLHKLLITMVDQ